MKIIGEKLNGVLILKSQVFFDNRGFLQESYSQKKFMDLGIKLNFVQDNHSFSTSKGTLRGLHFQEGDQAQTKLVRCIRGKVLDVVVDLRNQSPTFKQHFAIELSEDNNLQLLVPKGFAHGFLCLTDNCHVLYKMDEFYAPKHSSGIIWNDPTLSIDWPLKESDLILSEQDSQLDYFNPNKKYF